MCRLPHQLDCREYAFATRSCRGSGRGVTSDRRRLRRQRPLVPLPVVGDDRAMTAVEIEPVISARTVTPRSSSPRYQQVPEAGAENAQHLGDRDCAPDARNRSPKGGNGAAIVAGASSTPGRPRPRLRRRNGRRRHLRHLPRWGDCGRRFHDCGKRAAGSARPDLQRVDAAGASIVHVELDLGGETWCITRTATNGAHL